MVVACPICSENTKDKPPTAVTTCRHCKQVFCKSCLDEALKHKPYCPTCTVPLRKIKGNQPSGGTMTVHAFQHKNLPGYEKYGTIQIDYHIPGGKQGKKHPNPGHYFSGISRRAYLPDSRKGRKVLQLLRKAFDARLIFTVASINRTTDAVVWNDIHHKTNTHGGPTRSVYKLLAISVDCMLFIIAMATQTLHTWIEFWKNLLPKESQNKQFYC